MSWALECLGTPPEPLHFKAPPEYGIINVYKLKSIVDISMIQNRKQDTSIFFCGAKIASKIQDRNEVILNSSLEPGDLAKYRTESISTNAFWGSQAM